MVKRSLRRYLSACNGNWASEPVMKAFYIALTLVLLMMVGTVAGSMPTGTPTAVCFHCSPGSSATR